LELLNGYWFVRDLNSRNGIKVNGARCDSKWLMPGDVLSVAKHRFELVYTPEGAPPPPEDDDPFAVSLLEKAGLLQRGDRRRDLPPDGQPAKNPSEQVGPGDDGFMDWLDDPTPPDR
jgi:adenylate cyclase